MTRTGLAESDRIGGDERTAASAEEDSGFPGPPGIGSFPLAGSRGTRERAEGYTYECVYLPALANLSLRRPIPHVRARSTDWAKGPIHRIETNPTTRVAFYVPKGRRGDRACCVSGRSYKAPPTKGTSSLVGAPGPGIPGGFLRGAAR